MPQITAHADVFRDWDAVLGAVTQNAALLPGVDPYKAELEGFLAQARDLKVQQETLEGQRRGVTQKLDQVLESGRESVRKIRAFATIHFGSANLALAEFGMKPLLPKRRKLKAGLGCAVKGCPLEATATGK